MFMMYPPDIATVVTQPVNELYAIMPIIAIVVFPIIGLIWRMSGNYTRTDSKVQELSEDVKGLKADIKDMKQIDMKEMQAEIGDIHREIISARLRIPRWPSSSIPMSEAEEE